MNTFGEDGLKQKARSKTDVRELVENSWREIFAYDSQHHPDQLAPDLPAFTSYAWKKFDIPTALSVLRTEKPTYRALKSILFSGLCTWIICPSRNQLRRHGMLLVGIEQLQAAEALGQRLFEGRKLPNRELLGDITGRMRVLGPSFYSDFYYPVGGLAQVLRTTSRNQFAKSIAHHSKDLAIPVAIMEVYDYHAKHIKPNKPNYPASDSKGFEIVRKIFGEGRKSTPIGFDKLQAGWRGAAESLAFIYAASTIVHEGEQTLLDLMRSGEANFEEHGYALETLISRARYAAETILMSSTKPELGQNNLNLIPDVAIEATPEPAFDSSEQAYIEAEFDKVAILKNRQPGQLRPRLSRRGPRTA